MPTKEKIRARQATLKARRHELDLQITDLQKQLDAPAPTVKKREKPKAPSKKKATAKIKKP